MSSATSPANAARKPARQNCSPPRPDAFVERGFAATPGRCRFPPAWPKGTLYLYYENKEALFKAVIQEGVIPVIRK